MLHAIKEDGHAEEVYRSPDAARTSSPAGRDSQANGIVYEGAASADSSESRRRWSELDRSRNRRSLTLPDQDGREHPATARHHRLTPGALQEPYRDATQ